MPKLLLYFLVLLLAVWGGLKIAVDPGYLLLAYRHTTVEMPLWLGATAVVMTFIVGYMVIRILSRIFHLGTTLRAWSRQRRRQRAWQRTHRGLIALAAGESKLAEKELLRAAPEVDHALVNYLGAARAAHAQQAFERRDIYLSQCATKGRSAQLAVGLTRARLYLRQHHYEQALVILQQLQTIMPKHPPVLYLLKKAYLHLQDWASLELLLPVLTKYTALSEAHLTRLTQRIYQGLLRHAVLQTDNGATLIWQRMPKILRTQPALIEAYLPYLTAQSPAATEKFLRPLLDKQLMPSLIEVYGQSTSLAPDQQLSRAEQWLSEYPQQPELLLTLGRLCLRNQLWGKARSYFEASALLAPRPITYFELGKLAEQLNDFVAAMEYYRQGLTLITK